MTGETPATRPKPKAPLSIRIADELRNRVADFASKSEISFNAAIGTLLERGLTGDSVRRASGPYLEPEAKPVATLKKQANREAAKPGAGFCEHRVSLTSFCARCSGMV